MEQTLTYLFDYQRFEGSRTLEEVIDEVHARYAFRELSLEDMEMIAAAGVPEKKPDRKMP